MSLLSALLRDQAAALDFWSSDRVQPVIDRVAAELVQRRETVLLAVSAEGERVVGALVYANPGVFSMWHPCDDSVPVLVDGVTASLLAADDVARRFDLAEAPLVVALEAPGFDAPDSARVVRVPLDGPRARLAAV